MKTWILLLVVFLSALNLKAQNWSVFNPSYRYNYSLESEGYTTAVVFADSNVTSGSNAVYSLNRIVVKCDLSQPSMQVQGCTNPNYWLANQPQFLQRRIIYSGQDYRLSDTGTYIIKHREAISTPWTFNATYSITAQVQSEIQKNVFGVLDSVRIIMLSTSDTILLSKQFGIIKYPATFGQQHYYKLRGIENKASYDVTALYGEKVPNYYDFFKLKPGVKHYYSKHRSLAGTMNTCDAALYGIKTVLNSSMTGTVITNTVREQQIGCPTPNFSACPRVNGGCDPWFYYIQLRYPYSTLSALHTNTVQNNPNPYDLTFNTGYNNQLKNMNYGNMSYTIIKFGMTDNMHFYKTYGSSCFSNHVKSFPIFAPEYQTISLEATSQANIFRSYTPIDMGSGVTYIEGYGMVNEYFVIFETNNKYCTSLIVDGNDSLGGTDALTMSLNDAVSQEHINRVYPNPVRYDLHINVPYEAQNKGSIILRDVLGKTLETIVTNGEENYQLNIEPYATGIYFLSIQSPGYSMTYKVIKD